MSPRQLVLLLSPLMRRMVQILDALLRIASVPQKLLHEELSTPAADHLTYSIGDRQIR